MDKKKGLMTYESSKIEELIKEIEQDKKKEQDADTDHQTLQ